MAYNLGFAPCVRRMTSRTCPFILQMVSNQGVNRALLWHNEALFDVRLSTIRDAMRY